jgi:hypothetical protein
MQALPLRVPCLADDYVTRKITSKVQRREQRQGVVKVNAGAAGVAARELLPWTANRGAQKHFDPEHPLAGDSKGSSLVLVLYFLV